MKILAVDIGGTFIKYAFMNERGEFLSRGKIKTPKNREGLICAVVNIYDEEPGTDGISISMPGIIDSEKGYCVMGGALRYNDGFYLRSALYERCPVKIHMENDAKCAAMAEAAVGNLKDAADGFVLILGTMIGGGFVMDHKLYWGKHFSAGEVSYLITDRDAAPTPETVWGNRCGVPGLCKLYAERKSLDPDKVDGVMVFDAVSRGEREAEESLMIYTREIAVQLFNIQNLLDPEKIAIGGGISAQPVLFEYIRKNLDEFYGNCPYYVPRAKVVPCRFLNDANLIGALQCFLES